MNIYSENFIKAAYKIDGVYYEVQKDRHSESLYFYYWETAADTKQSKHYFTHNAPLSSAWMRILDYDMPDTDGSEIFFDMVQTAGKRLPIEYVDEPSTITDFLKSLSSESLTKIVSEIMSLLKPAIEGRTVLGYLYPFFYAALRDLYNYIGGQASKRECAGSFAVHLRELKQELDGLSTNYIEARTYCEAVFLTDNAPGAEIDSDTVAAIYHAYCREKGIVDFMKDSLSYWAVSSSAQPSENTSWQEYLENHKQEHLSYKIKKATYLIFNFYEFLYVGIDLMIEAQAVLRTCKLCGGYFRIKYSSSQEYCTRLYRDTKAACNEYASRKSYKDKIFQHPIHQEFTKAYNKLYGRIRRGKLPADTPLMDQLKKLHDDYYEKYENTHQKDREAVWKEYIEKNKELLM